MKKESLFYGLIALLVFIDSFLLSSPNLLGKVGLFIYKYHYLRTFPRTLLSVSIAILVVVLISELIKFLVKRELIKRSSGRIALIIFILLSAATLIKTGIDFSTWTYGHTGARFKYGAYLLPILWIAVFGYHLIKLPKANSPWPTSPSMDEKKVQQ